MPVWRGCELYRPEWFTGSKLFKPVFKDNGVELYRFKTGTPARIDKRSVNFDVMEEQFGDEKIVPFSFTNKEEDIKREQISCWLTYTNEETHKIIRDNLDRSPIYAGVIEGTGPRYCPSIEDKVVRLLIEKDISFSSSQRENLQTKCMLEV